MLVDLDLIDLMMMEVGLTNCRKFDLCQLHSAPRNKQHFHKPVFISVTFADSHGCLKNFVKLVFQQLIGSFHQVLQALGFWVILLKYNFNDEI